MCGISGTNIYDLLATNVSLNTQYSPKITVASREHHGVSNHRHHDSSFNIFRLTSKKTSKLRTAVPFCKDNSLVTHDGVIKWKHFPCYWPFVREIQRSPVNCPHKGQWREALMFPLTRALNKRLSKSWWGWWFKTPSRSLWHHCNAMDSHCKSSIMLKAFSCHDVFMLQSKGLQEISTE